MMPCGHHESCVRGTETLYCGWCADAQTVAILAEKVAELSRRLDGEAAWHLCRAGERPVPCDPPTKVAPGALPRR